MGQTKTYHNKVDRKKDNFQDQLIQRKLEWFRMEENGELGNDPLEKEADDSAKKIVHGDGIDSENLSSASSQPQGKADDNSVAMENSISPQLESSKGGGQQLDDSIKGEMESQMNTDLSDVRIHTDSNANKMSEDINAKAFAHGQDIYFKDGNFDTSSNEGKELLAHELTHTEQQGNVVARTVQKMDDPLVIEERAQWKGLHYGQILTKLGPDYDIQNLDLMFFGIPDGRAPLWRREIILYYLLERGWEINKDPIPQWIEHKFIYDNLGNEFLAVYTPIPGMRGRNAAFGFVRWDLGFGSNKSFYRYQEIDSNISDYRNYFISADTKESLEQDKLDGKNQKSGSTTKEELVYKPGYQPLKSHAAISLAYDLVKSFQQEPFIRKPGNLNEDQVLDHRKYISLQELLEADYEASGGSSVQDEVPSRRDYFALGPSGSRSIDFSKVDLETKKGLTVTTADKAIIFVKGTTLGVAKEKFIDGNNYSSDELAEEGLASNNLIQHFDQFLLGVANAVYYMETVGSGEQSLSDSSVLKAQEALAEYKNIIIRAYLFPESPVDFKPAEQLMAQAKGILHDDVYGSKGLHTVRAEFGREAIKELKKDSTVGNYETCILYIEEILSLKVPEHPDKTGKIDLMPLVELELALGVLDVMGQVSMLSGLQSYLDASSISSSTHNIRNYKIEFLTILGNMSMILGNRRSEILQGKKPDYMDLLRGQVLLAQNILTEKNVDGDPKYATAIEIDIFLTETGEKSQLLPTKVINFLTPVVLIACGIGMVIVSFWAGGVVGAFFGEIIATALTGTLGATAATLIGTGVSLGTAAIVTTLLMESYESAMYGEAWGTDMEEAFWWNLFFHGLGKIITVVVKTIKSIPAIAKAVGKAGSGVWKTIEGGRTTYYIEESATAAIKASTKISQQGLALYPKLRASLAEIQRALSLKGLDPYIIENGLKGTKTATLEFFEQNPAKLLEASEKLSVQLTGILNISPVTKLAQTSRYLDAYAANIGMLEPVFGMTNIFKGSAGEMSNAGKVINEYRMLETTEYAGNYGYLEGNAGGITKNSSKVWHSGKALAEEPQIFKAIEVEGSKGKTWLRSTDAEYKMLNSFANELGAIPGEVYPAITGELKIISEFPYCMSCQGIIQQFNTMFPNIKLILLDGVKM